MNSVRGLLAVVRDGNSYIQRAFHYHARLGWVAGFPGQFCTPYGDILAVAEIL